MLWKAKDTQIQHMTHLGGRGWQDRDLVFLCRQCQCRCRHIDCCSMLSPAPVAGARAPRACSYDCLGLTSLCCAELEQRGHVRRCSRACFQTDRCRLGRCRAVAEPAMADNLHRKVTITIIIHNATKIRLSVHRIEAKTG